MDGEIKIGSYVVEEPIGRGGMGVVYRGRHATLPRKVAIKAVAARGTRDLRRLRARFEREAYVQSQLDHPGIVKIYDYVVTEQTYYIVMELVEGSSLAALLERREPRPDLARSLDLFEEILSAVGYAHGFTYRDRDGSPHRGIVHRDLKPHNILVGSDGRVKITDFGIVKLVGADETETSGQVYGSPLYVSPEQVEDAHVDQRSDIYSLGVILYEMLAGRPPFGGFDQPMSRTEILRAHVRDAPRPPSEINPLVSPELERVVCRALEKKPERRYANVYDFWRALRAARGREASDIVEPAFHVSSAPEGARESGAQQVAGVATEHVGRESYLTQPIRAVCCVACGAESESGDRRCRKCGQDLTASPSTTRLTRAARARALPLAAALAALALLCALAFYLARGGRADVNDDTRTETSQRENAQEETSQRENAQPVASSDARTASADAHAPLVELKPAAVSVDSSFEGYGAEPLTDGVTDVRRIASLRYNRANWASAETPVPHWIELSFERPARVAAVYIYWGFDRTRFMPSRRVELQTPGAGDTWQTVATLEPGGDFDRTAFEFSPLETSRVRIFQPAQRGPAGRPFVMWVREVQVFRIEDAS